MTFADGTRQIREYELRPSREPAVASSRRLGRFRNLAAIAVVGMAIAAIVGPAGLPRANGAPLMAAAVATPASTDQLQIVPDATSTMTELAASATPAIAFPDATDTPTPAPTDGPTPAPTLPDPPLPPPQPVGWVTVVNDQFNSGGLPSRWRSYDGPYGSGPRNCAIPSHAVVAGGYLHLMMSYETSTSLPCGAGWYTAGLGLRGYSSVDQQVTVRFRVVDSGVAGHFIVPMRWPDNDSGWPAAGEEDYCETDVASGCTTYLHYGARNSQNQHSYSVDLTQWHTLRFQRLNHVVSAFIDNMARPVWTFTGNSTTLPDTLKHVVLQQECHSKCPAGTAGSEDIQIDWITVANPG